jgi:hypothetical protein
MMFGSSALKRHVQHFLLSGLYSINAKAYRVPFCLSNSRTVAKNFVIMVSTFHGQTEGLMGSDVPAPELGGLGALSTLTLLCDDFCPSNASSTSGREVPSRTADWEETPLHDRRTSKFAASEDIARGVA